MGYWGCDAVDDNQTQRWTLVVYATETAGPDDPVFASSTADCLPGGACGKYSWTMLREESFGCHLDYLFDFQFSGSNVRILNGTIAAGSTCQITLGANFGTGNANAAYPAATAASGSWTVNWNSPAGPSGGTFFFRAFRVE